MSKTRVIHVSDMPNYPDAVYIERPVTMRKYDIIGGAKYRNGPAMFAPSRAATPRKEVVMPNHSIPSTTEDTTEDIPHGYCQCGCGQKTTIIKRSDKSRGLVKGEPNRFVASHHNWPKVSLPSLIESGDTLLIPLQSKKYPGLFAVVDVADREKVASCRWYPHRHRSGIFYAATQTRRTAGKRERFWLHRLIQGVSDPRVQVDHVNHDGLDNRRKNLRIATNQQNQFNQRPTRGASSCFRGVSWVSAQKKWHAQIRHNNKLYHLGFFDDEVEAAITYDRAAEQLFGDRAFLNCRDGEIAS